MGVRETGQMYSIVLAHVRPSMGADRVAEVDGVDVVLYRKRTYTWSMI